MLIIKKPNNKTLMFVAEQLRAGAVVVYPTDTAYAIGCDATNAKAVARIFKIKGRAASKALPLIVANAKMAKRFFVLTTHNSQLATRHWPGPLSIILKAKKGIVKKILKSGTAAVRVPDSGVARELASLLGRPLVATSANLSGLPACYSIKSFLQQTIFERGGDARRPNSPYPLFSKEGLNITPPFVKGRVGRVLPDVVLDIGALPRRKPSTIVAVAKSGTIEILRKGPVKI